MVYTRLYMVMHGYTLLYVVIMSLMCLWLSLVLYRIIIGLAAFYAWARTKHFGCHSVITLAAAGE